LHACGLHDASVYVLYMPPPNEHRVEGNIRPKVLF